MIMSMLHLCRGYFSFSRSMMKDSMYRSVSVTRSANVAFVQKHFSAANAVRIIYTDDTTQSTSRLGSRWMALGLWRRCWANCPCN